MPSFSTTNHALQFGSYGLGQPVVTIIGTDTDGYIIYDMSTAISFQQFAPNTKYFALEIAFDIPFVLTPGVIISPANSQTAAFLAAEPGLEFFVDQSTAPTVNKTGNDVTTTYFRISGISSSTPLLGPQVLMWSYSIAGQQVGIGSGGTVTAVNTDSTLTGGPITTSGTLGINFAHANTWSAKQTFNNHAAVDGYTINLSSGAALGQVLGYDGYNFVADNTIGNWTINGNNADLVSAGSMHVGTTIATQVIVGAADTANVIAGGVTVSTSSGAGHSDIAAGAFQLRLNTLGGGVYINAPGGLLPISGPVSSGAAGSEWSQNWAKVYGTVIGTPIASASTISPIAGVTHITGSVQINTINLPTPSFIGTIKLISDNGVTLGSGGNISSNGQVNLIAGQIYDATYDGTLWYFSAGNASKVIYINPAAVSDLGVAINTADAQLGGGAGTIEINNGNATISTQIVLSANRILQFGMGTYTNHVNGPMCLYRDYSVIRGRGTSTIILESSINIQTGHIIFEPYEDTLNSHANGNFGNCILEDMQLLGAAPTFDSVTSAIALGNSVNTWVRRIYFNATKTIGINVGGSSADGYHSDNTWVTNCLFYNVGSQNVGVVNSRSVHIDYNTFRASGQIGSAGAAYIDFEPNVSTDILENFTIIGNLIDARTSPNPGSDGIIVQSADATLTGPGVVANNSIIGGSIDGTITNDISIGIYLIGVRDVKVIGNNVRRTGQSGIRIDNGAVPSARCVVSDNQMRSVGGGGTNAFTVNGTYHIISNNQLFAPTGEGSSSNAMSEDIGGDHNQFFNNFIEGTSQIVLNGANSRAFNNNINGRWINANGPAFAISTKTSAYTLTENDYTILADATGASFNVTLPDATLCNGRVYIVKRINAGANSVTLITTSSQTIDGALTYTLFSQNSWINLQSDGTNWRIISVNFNTISTMADLRSLAIPSTTPTSINLFGYYATGDGGQGEFYWDAASTLADDGGLVIKPTAVSGAGRWRRIYSHGKVDVRWFGAIGDDTSHPLSNYFGSLGAAQAVYPHATSLTDELDWAGIQAAIYAIATAYTPAAFLSSIGGEVFVSKGIYHCNQPLTMHATIGLGLTLRGSGHGSVGTGNNNNGEAVLLYTVNDSRRFLDCRSTGGLTLDNLSIMYSSSTYGGKLVDISHYNGGDTQGFTIRNCMLSGGTQVLAGTGAHSLLYMSNAISSLVDNCIFGVAVRAIFLREQDGSYANAISISNCNFVYHKYSILNAGESVQVLDCIFEGSGGVMQAAYYEEYTDVIASPANTITFDSTLKTITRSSGSWITDGFVLGMTVTVFEQIGTPGADNTGTIDAVVSNVTATVLTFAGATTIKTDTRTSDCKVYSYSVVQDKPSPTTDATLGIQFVFDATTQTITRNNGSWIDDLVFIGASYSIAGTASNNGVFGPVTGFTSTVLSFAADTLTFAAAGNTITRSSGSFANDGWTIGMQVVVAGTVSNNGTYGNVSNVSPTVLTITGASFAGEASTTADVYSLFETRFQARTQASPGVVFTNETTTSGHLFQGAGGGPISFVGCWMGDQFLPSSWFNFGGCSSLKLSGCQIIGNLRAATFRQSASGIEVDAGCHIVTLQEPFKFESQSSLIIIHANFGGASADIITYPVTNPPTSVDMHTTFLPAGPTSPDIIARTAKSWLYAARDQFIVSKNAIGSDQNTTPALRVDQGGGQILGLGGLEALSGAAILTNHGSIQSVGSLVINYFGGHTKINAFGFSYVDIGYPYHDGTHFDPTSLLRVNGAIATSYRTLAADGYIDDHDSFTDLDATLGNVTATLPDATTCKGREYTFKRIDNASDGYSCIISPINSQTIDGAVSYLLENQNATVTIKSDSTNWRIKDKSNTSSNASNVQLIDTNPHNIVTYTPNLSGNYLVYVYYRVITATTSITITISWTDGSGAQTATVINSAQIVGSYSAMPTYINIATNNAITVTATAGTANQVFVSASIVQL